MSSRRQPHILTVDVEDNFTYDELVDKGDWGRYEKQVIENTLKIVKLLASFNSYATFFVVGSLAERHPELVAMILENEHEVASHSYSHRPLRNLSKHDIESDIQLSAKVLRAIVGQEIIGFRAMGYSVPADERWFYKALKKYGFRYDSSKKHPISEGQITFERNQIYSIYPSIVNFCGKRLIFSGGTYFRIFPSWIIEKGLKQYAKLNQPAMIYIHPWEFNQDQPKRQVSLKQKILQSPITFTTERKLIKLLMKYEFTSVRSYLNL